MSTQPFLADFCGMIVNSLLEGRFKWTAVTAADAFTIRDNIFDKTTIVNGSGGTLSFGYNGYLIGYSRLVPNEPSDQVMTSFYYDQGPLGPYYMGWSYFQNVGSRLASSVGLYHYTTRVHQAKEANSTVDLGFHYVASPRATFVGSDTTTKGDWKGSYGADGYNVFGDSQSYPSYTSSVTPSGKSEWLWDSAPVDVRALQRGQSAGRIAHCWYSATFYELEVRLLDNHVHRLALYCLDWDNAQRSQRITFYDYGTGNFLDSRDLSSFSGGQYWIWDIRGSIKIKLENTGPWNCVASGLFFGPSPAADLGDADSDGICDYFEDRNGNGLFDSGETDWNVYNSANGLAGAVGLLVFTPLE